MKRLAIAAIATLLFTSVLFSQAPMTGLPSFGSFHSIGFDTANLQNLNDNVSIPIVAVPSRGGNFNFNIAYNSLLWQKVTGTPNTWQPVTDASGNPTWGWQTDIYGGVVSHRKSTGTIKCFDGTGGWYWGTRQIWSGYSYKDILGTNHGFSIQYVSDCNGDTITGSALTSDGSGFSVDVADWDNPGVRSPGGLTTPTGGSVTDTNGNFVSKTIVNSSESDWKDSAGHTVLKVITGTNSIQYQYQDTTGSYQTTTLNLSPFTIKTQFLCTSPAVSDYTGTTTVNLATSLVLPNGKQYTFAYEPTPSNPTYVTGRIKRITLPTGGYYELQYPGANDSINCSDGTTTNLTRVVSDGTTSSTWQFVRNSINGSAGTTTITAPQLPYDSAANQTTVMFDGSAHETSRKVYQGSVTGIPLRTVNTTWAANGTPATRITLLDDNSTQAEVDTTYDSFGNLTLAKEYDWGAGVKGTLVRQTATTFLSTTAYTSRNIVNRVTSVVVKDGAGTPMFRQDTAYDEAGYINTACPTGAAQHDDAGHGCTFTVRGDPTTVTMYKTPATPGNPVPKHTYYDWFGNVTKADLNCCQQKQWNYSATTQYAYPDSIVSGSSSPTLTTSFTYNAYTGQIATTTDENLQVASLAYDSMKRPTTVTRPDNTQLTTTYDDIALTVTSTMPITSTTSVKQVAYADGLGRAIKGATKDASLNTYSIVEQQYDPLGRSYKTSNPYNAGSASYWTETDFDALGRAVKTILPDGQSSSLSYSTNTATSTDPASKKRKTQVDGLGRLASAFEPDSGGNLTQQTSYSYNLLDALTGVTQGVQTRTYGYDNLGRLTSVATPETNNLGYQYAYNDFDLLTQRTDPRGVITTYTYDTLNRPYQISYNVGSTGVPTTSTITYTYGTNSSQNNNGRLITVADGVGSENYSYDILGRKTQVQKVVSGTTYTLGYGYNLASEPTSITYPSGRVVQPQYDMIGRASTVASGGTNYASAFAYNPAQQVTGFSYGNGDTATFTYSADRVQLTSLTYKQGATSLFKLSYWYKTDATNCPGGAAGNNSQIQCITDNVAAGRSVSYTYDALNRLNTAVTTGGSTYPQWGLSFIYDRYGNRTQQNVTAGTAPSNSLAIDPATNRITGYAYDASGNLKVEPLTPSNNYSYDAENHMVTFSGSTSATYNYNGNGLRVKKVSGGTTTVYLFSGAQVVAEYVNGAAPSAPTKEYIYLNSKLLATIASGVTTYHHPDHLSVRMSTNSSGAKVGDQGHYPFGESWYLTNTTTKWQFTTYERDSESGNDYAMARYQVNRVGRFASPDPLGGSSQVPQSLNRYTYVTNDPLSFSDPSGRLLDPTCGVYDRGCGGAGSGGMDNGGQGMGGGWGFGGGGGGGGAGVEACGVDIYCIQNGGIGPFGSPVAQIHCDSDGYCMTGSWAFSTYLVGGTYSIDWAGQRQAEINAAVNKINKAFSLIAKNMGLDPNQEVPVKVQYNYGVWNVQLNCDAGTGCTVDQNAANKAGWPDPITFMHQGDSSWYFGSLFGFDAGHLIGNDPAGAHIDPFGPFNPLHYLIQMPAMLFPGGPVGYTTCSISGGCN